MLPSIFGEGLFDDWMSFPFRSMVGDADRKLYGKRAGLVMQTDLRDNGENGYELLVDLPGFKKDQVKIELLNGHLSISAEKGLESEEKDKNGKIIHQERYSGAMRRTFYVGDHVKEEDIKAKFEDGVLKIEFPKEKPAELPEKKTILIEG